MTLSVSRYFCAAFVAATLVGPGISVGADEKRVPVSRAEVSLSFAPLVKSAAPAVVNIYTRRVVRARRISPLFNDPFFRRFFGNQFAPGSRQNQRVQNSLGSGVIVSADGLIVTNSHVIDKADEITVVLTDRREFEAEVVTRDEGTDLAVLRIKAEDEKLPFLELRDSDTLEVGDLVLAIGNPFGVGQTVTSGIVSALARTARGVSDYGFFIQTDAAINPAIRAARLSPSMEDLSGSIPRSIRVAVGPTVSDLQYRQIWLRRLLAARCRAGGWCAPGSAQEARR